MTPRTITDDIDGALSGEEIAQLRMLVRSLSNQIVCLALLDQRRTALLTVDDLHRHFTLGTETMRSSIVLAHEALRFLDGPSDVRPS